LKYHVASDKRGCVPWRFLQVALALCNNWSQYKNCKFLSVQCYAMHGQNINLPVCVCVCVSVTLPVNSPTGQTPQRIFTVDSLKDADLCKDVLFGGLDDE